MAKLPYYKMYPGDADADENFRLMSYEQRGVYWSLLNHAWLNDGLPASPHDIQSILRIPEKEFVKCWERVSTCFPENNGRRRNPRQEEERSKAIRKSESATESIRTRYERSTNEPLRAYESESEPVVEFGFKKENQDVAILKIDGKPLFERLIGSFLAAGVKLSEPQMLAAGTEWVSLDDAEWVVAVEFSENRAKATEARWMGLPASYLRAKSWKAKGPGRILPDPPGMNGSKREQNLAKAMAIFRAERGEE